MKLNLNLGMEKITVIFDKNEYKNFQAVQLDGYYADYDIYPDGGIVAKKATMERISYVDIDSLEERMKIGETIQAAADYFKGGVYKKFLNWEIKSKDEFNIIDEKLKLNICSERKECTVYLTTEQYPEIIYVKLQGGMFEVGRGKYGFQTSIEKMQKIVLSKISDTEKEEIAKLILDNKKMMILV